MGAAVDRETYAASGDFGEVFFNFMLVVNNHLVSEGNDQPLFFGEALAAAQLGDAVLAAHAFQNDPDLFLRRILLACRPADVP